MKTTEQFDFLNRLTSINSTTNSVAVASFNYAYNSANQRLNVTNADSSYWSWQYDNLGQVTGGVKRWSDNSLVAGGQFGYAFDTIGNRTSAQFGGDQHGNGLLPATYTADLDNRYSQRTIPSAVDILGVATNAATVSVNNLPTLRHGTFYRAELGLNNSTSSVFQSVTNLAVLNEGTNADIMTNITGNVYLPQNPEAFTYDLDGNLKTDGHWNYYWDAEDRLISMTNNSSTAPALSLIFAYDYKGRRVEKLVYHATAGLSTNLFVNDGWNLAVELNAANNAIIRSYIWGTDLSGSMQGAGGVGGLLGMSSPSSAQFVAYDGNGNVNALIDVTNATISAQYEYGPFGELIRATGPMATTNALRFSTKYDDNETDLLYYGYRYYNPSTGRWLSRDPIGKMGGVNLYSFISNQPTINNHALGLLTWQTPIASTRIDPEVEKDDPDFKTYGVTTWRTFAPAAYAYRAIATCPCPLFKVNIPGDVQVAYWWVKGDEVAKQHELTHVTQHFKPAFDSFKENAEAKAFTCMNQGKANCIASVINNEMSTAYKWQAVAVASEWDCEVYGGGHGSGSVTCKDAQAAIARYSQALTLLQNALTKCDKAQ